MTNPTQFLLLIVITILTLLLIFVAIEVVVLIRDIRTVVKNFKGKSTKELTSEIRRFFHKGGLPLRSPQAK